MIVGFQLQLQYQLARLTAKQYFYLCAIALEQDKMCSREILEKYKLGSSGNVARIRENLLSKELIELQREAATIIDPLLKHRLLTQITSQK
jgi:hypothetical protein